MTPDQMQAIRDRLAKTTHYTWFIPNQIDRWVQMVRATSWDYHTHRDESLRDQAVIVANMAKEATKDDGLLSALLAAYDAQTTEIARLREERTTIARLWNERHDAEGGLIAGMAHNGQTGAAGWDWAIQECEEQLDHLLLDTTPATTKEHTNG